ncbi:MAG: hypothetical protein D0530_00460 [Methylococcales bacterium]|nr:MAG: hypothetical protein D0530_00460 [Methylococcales bacterium]
MSKDHLHQIAIVGCYGDGNVGDESILQATTQFLRKSSQNQVKICVLSNNPEETRNIHGIEAILTLNLFKPSHWYALFCKGKLWAILQTLRRSDLLLMGGGDLLRDDIGFIAYIGVASAAILMKLFGKPFALWSIGIGPINTRSGMALTKWLLDNAVFAYFRERKSLERAQVLAPNRDGASLFYYPDIALFMDPPLTLRSRSNKPPVLAVSLLDFEAAGHRTRNIQINWQAYLVHIKQLIRQFLDEGYTIHLIPFDPQDIPFLYLISADLNSKSVRTYSQCMTPDESKKALSEADAFVGMRLHACILAVSLGIPTVAISYDRKVENFMSGVGLTSCTLRLENAASNLNIENIHTKHLYFAQAWPTISANIDSIHQEMKSHLGQILFRAICKYE